MIRHFLGLIVFVSVVVAVIIELVIIVVAVSIVIVVVIFVAVIIDKLPFLSSATEVSTGPTCQFGFVCVCVCLSGLFFKASYWIIYWLLTVVLATYLSE